MRCLNEEVQKKLDIYTKGNNHKKYIKCLIRRKEILINGRPEELVRQIFIHFIIKESGLFPDKINMNIEVNNHDIEIHEKQKRIEFQPYKPPLIIVEMKREDADLEKYHDQIKGYMTRSCCNIGILYNFNQIIVFNRKDNQFESKKLNSLFDIRSIVLESEIDVQNDVLEFEKAQNGDFDNFAYLVNKYGKYKTNTVIFKLTKQQEEIRGSFFRIQGSKVYYDICGKYSKKQESFDVQDFERLISIKHLRELTINDRLGRQ